MTLSPDRPVNPTRLWRRPDGCWTNETEGLGRAHGFGHVVRRAARTWAPDVTGEQDTIRLFCYLTECEHEARKYGVPDECQMAEPLWRLIQASVGEGRCPYDGTRLVPTGWGDLLAAGLMGDCTVTHSGDCTVCSQTWVLMSRNGDGTEAWSVGNMRGTNPDHTVAFESVLHGVAGQR